MKTLFGYLKGLPLLLAIALLFLVVGIFLIFFNILFAAAVGIILILVIFIVPYYMGRAHQPEEPGSYKLKDIKE
jgi:ABC-type transport system involved in cytochrome bd biosynthesis fused ATPase/permease subunit|tara:strand:+ start:629 stop:850 length:222 start_codon:yes stop_codon:yes gene_type:complete